MPTPWESIVRLVGLVLIGVALAVSPAEGQEALHHSWVWEWSPAPGEGSPAVEVCSLLYGKEWAYAVEIDDGPASTLTVAQPLLGRFGFTDAPPGVSGGKPLPFVGGAAVMVQWVGTDNPTHLTWGSLRELERRGWGVLNHSYWHTGNHWDPAQALKPADFRRELYWSRALLGGPPWSNPGDAHFVYPSGDYNYRPYLAEAGVRSASRVGGTCRSLLADPPSLLDLDRNDLDEVGWAKRGDPMAGFPRPGPGKGDLVIDFTHEIDADPASANYRRWTARLAEIASRFGQAGADSVWCAPTTVLVDYALAARSAKVEARRGGLTVRLPDPVPGSRLTLKLTGLSEKSTLEPPPGGSLYRQGDRAWITTPRIGRQRAPMPGPRLVLAYEGGVGEVTFDRPVAVAGVRLLQSGEAKPLRVELVRPGGAVESLVSPEAARVKPRWGSWLLLPTIPDRPAVEAQGVRVAPDPSLTRMEVWALADEGPGLPR